MKLDAQSQSLIISAKLGKEEALNLLFARYQPRILRIVRLRLTKDLRSKLKLQSMDIVQEVFMYALQHLKDFEPKSQGHFLNWLAKKVEHYICDRLDYISRDKRKADGGEVSIDRDISLMDKTDRIKIQVKDDGTTPSQFAVKQEREQLIDSMLQQLDTADRELIIHRNLEEMTFAEIGELIGKSEDAVRKQYGRAFRKLIDLSEKTLKPIIVEQSYRQYKDGL